jgi:hypothetical protein
MVTRAKAVVKAALARLSRLSGKWAGLDASANDASYLAADVPMSSIASHASHLHCLYTHGNHQGMRILEVGSREVTGPSAGRQMFTKAEYIGFDYYPGKNVDVVGDAHRLSSYFQPGEKFDIIYSSACFEHFAMPWVVAVEIASFSRSAESYSSRRILPSRRMSGLGTSFTSPTWRYASCSRLRLGSSASRRDFPTRSSDVSPRSPIPICAIGRSPVCTVTPSFSDAKREKSKTSIWHPSISMP